MAWNLENALKSLQIPGAEWVGLREVRDTTTSHSTRDQKPEVTSVDVSHGVMVEVLFNGQFGYAATAEVSEAGLRDAAERALCNAKAAAKWSLYKFTAEQRPKAVGEYRSPFVRSFDALSPEELYDILLSTGAALKVSDKIIKTSVAADLIESEVRFVSTNGSDTWQKFSFVQLHMEAVAKEGNVVQKRTDKGWSSRCYQAGAEVFVKSEWHERANRIGREALELLDAEECPTETTTLVLAPDQMKLQIHESIGHPLELDRILGDERNYAGFSFVKPSDFGSLQYGSPLLNVTFDPSVSGELASYGFDDCGNKAVREFIIKDGILQRGLGSLESQVRSGLQGVANFRACSWNRAPIDRMANLNVEPGKSSFEEIIASVENGVYMEANRSWSIDDYRNKFQFGCEYARKIEKGKLTKVLRNPNYRGTTLQFWRGLSFVGNASTSEFFGTPHCGKGEPNQSIRVGHASPVCAFKGVEVFGGAE